MYLETPDHKAIEILRGAISYRQGSRLAYLASIVPVGGTIVEIGSFCGKSACFMAAAVKHAGTKVPVHCVDLWYTGGKTQQANHSYKKFKRIFDANVVTFQLENIVVPHMVESTAFAKSWKTPIDLLFIDAGHSYTACLADYQAWYKFIKPGGWIAFHDYVPRFHGVMKVVDKHVIPSNLFENVHITHDMVVFKDKTEAPNTMWSAQRRIK